jgi:probable rRNA maturation factor
VTRAAGEAEPDRRRTVYLPPWRVDVIRRPGIPGRPAATTLASAVARALEAAGAPSPGSVTVVLTDDAELAELNAEHMGLEGPTDVLSFPMLPPDSFVRSRRATRSPRPADWPRATRDPGGRRTHIGDIAISVERAIEQAAEGRGGQTGDVRWSAADELRLLVTHGTLHLCGWDHAEPSEETAMRALERELLER